MKNELPTTIHVLFENGLLLGSFIKKDAAENLQSARRAAGKNVSEVLTFERPRDIAPDRNELISVEDQLPEAFVDVLVYCPRRSSVYPFQIGHWIDRKDCDPGDFWSIAGVSGGTAKQIEKGRPTHWMPLPGKPVRKKLGLHEQLDKDLDEMRQRAANKNL